MKLSCLYLLLLLLFESFVCFSQESNAEKKALYSFLCRDGGDFFAVLQGDYSHPTSLQNTNISAERREEFEEERRALNAANMENILDKYRKKYSGVSKLVLQYVLDNIEDLQAKNGAFSNFDKNNLLYEQAEVQCNMFLRRATELIPILSSVSHKKVLWTNLEAKYYSWLDPRRCSSLDAFEGALKMLCPTDSVKPILFKSGNDFFSVFGDTLIEYHFTFDNSIDEYCTVYPPGNVFFVQNFASKLPPTMQTCGIDSEGFIWISDISGNLAFFDTSKNQYLSHIVQTEESNIILIPRDNFSQSAFVFDKNKKAYVEHSVVPKSFANVSGDKFKIESFVTKRDCRALPDKTVKILYSDNDLIVSTSENKILIQSGNNKRKEYQVNIKSNEVIEEGLFDKKSQKVFLLIRPLTNEENEVIQKRKNENLYPVVLQFRPDKTVNPFEVRDLWNQHRLETISLMESAEVSQ